jgi:Spy/CpxP family protein refolding chaperone
MMRKTRVIGFAIAAILTAGTIAQAQTATPQPRQNRHAMGRGANGEGRGGLLRGVKLSDAEKARLKEIHAKYNTESKTLRESLRPAMQEARAARQKGDSAAVKAAWNRTAGDRQKLQALMTRERAEIRTALSAEHQTTFDANVTKLEQRRAAWEKNGKGGRGGRAAFRGHRAASQS